MERQLEHLVRLVDDLLDVSRILRGQIDLQRQPIELQVSGRLGGRSLQNRFLSHAAMCSMCHFPGAGLGGRRHGALTQVVANLLNNAAKFTSIPIGFRSCCSATTDRRSCGSEIGAWRSRRNSCRIRCVVQADSSPARSQGGFGRSLTLVVASWPCTAAPSKYVAPGRDQGEQRCGSTASCRRAVSRPGPAEDRAPLRPPGACWWSTTTSMRPIPWRAPAAAASRRGAGGVRWSGRDGGHRAAQAGCGVSRYRLARNDALTSPTARSSRVS